MLPRAREWARRQLSAALPSQPPPGTEIAGEDAVRVLSQIREHLIAACDPVVNAYSSVRWIWYLRRTDFSLVRGYLPNTETSVVRIAENLTGWSTRRPDDDELWAEVPLQFYLDDAAFPRLARILATAELINHVEGWLRRSSKNTRFVMVENDFPTLVEDLPLEAAIELYDERVVAAGSRRWHPSLSSVGPSAAEPLLLLIEMLEGGVGETPMWKGRFADAPEPFAGEGRFVFRPSALSDQRNERQLRGALEAMEEPEVAAAMIVMSQALMWHATWHAEQLGVGIPTVGYLLMRRIDLAKRVSEVLELADEGTWPAMDGFVPADSAVVLATIEGVVERGYQSAPGPILRQWRNGTVLIDAYALSLGLASRLRMSPSTGGARVNAIAREFEMAVQALVDEAGAGPRENVSDLRGKTLRIGGASITDVDAFMETDHVLVCISCKKFELARPYDAGDYVSVRNVKSNIEAAVEDWAEKIAMLTANPIGDNYDFSAFDRIVGLVVTPELAFVDSPLALASIELTDTTTVHAYISFGELHEVLPGLGA